MALFEREDTDFGSDVATRALSVAAVENDFVERVYEKLAKVYDVIFGPALHPGRLQAGAGGQAGGAVDQAHAEVDRLEHGLGLADDHGQHPGRLVAIERMAIRRGHRVLEVGVGTGINTSLYPKKCHVTGIDLSASMLERARERVAREGLKHVRLLEMDAARLTFADDTFDIVYAPYLVSVVPDPVQVVREMRRVCRTGGKIIILNHFRSKNPLLSRLEQAISPLTVHIGFKSDLDLPGFLAQAELQPVSIEKVNRPRIWSLVTCTKD
jgi:phosphatidylethanolamine/phosphatidyl-N-methylethanolamine N-methyltransferase